MEVLKFGWNFIQQKDNWSFFVNRVKHKDTVNFVQVNFNSALKTMINNSYLQ